MSLFGDLSLDEFAIALRSALASYGHVNPPQGFDALKMHDLGIDQNGTTYTSKSGRGKAIVVQQDDELIVAFRGTDHFNDIQDYDNISVTKGYYKQFQSLLNHVADYAKEGGLHVTFTGISLGGAVTNIIADHADDRWGQVFADANFVGIASPYLSHNRKADLFNFGFGNDIVYHVVPGSWTHGSRSLATKHVFLYENHRLTKTDNLDDRVSVHHVGNYVDAIGALADLQFDDGKMLADKLDIHSYVLFDSTKEKLQAGRLEHPGSSPLTVIGEDRKDRLYGASTHNHGSHDEWFFGRGGDDKIYAKRGDDLLYGGGGDDLLMGGRGVDYASGGAGKDQIHLEDNRDRASGGDDRDGFVVHDILPKNDKGHLSPAGDNPARVFIEDFVKGEDVLNLRRVDGDLDKKGDQPLHFAGYERYDASDGLDDLEKDYVNDTSPGSVTIFEDKSGDTLVIVNRDSDRSREMEIVLHGDVGDIRHDLLL
jgi:Ca2+-binding RTX toxin-like protein